MPDGGSRESVGLRALKMMCLMHPDIAVRREALLGVPRPAERARYRVNEQLFDDLEVYIDLWHGTGIVLP